MAYKTITAPATGAELAFDTTPKGEVPLNKIVTGGAGEANELSSTNRLPVELPAGYATNAKQDATIAAIQGLTGTEYETVDVSQGAQVLGTTGAAGDLLSGVVLIPSTVSPGAVSVKDGADGVLFAFVGIGVLAGLPFKALRANSEVFP